MADRGLTPEEDRAFGARFFGQGASLSGVIEVPGELLPDKARELARSWGKKHGGKSTPGGRSTPQRTTRRMTTPHRRRWCLAGVTGTLATRLGAPWCSPRSTLVAPRVVYQTDEVSSQADAALIAAAPDLAATVERLTGENERLRAALGRITRYPTSTASEALMQNIAGAALTTSSEQGGNR